jgi:hypothetical protein
MYGYDKENACPGKLGLGLGSGKKDLIMIMEMLGCI